MTTAATRPWTAPPTWPRRLRASRSPGARAARQRRRLASSLELAVEQAAERRRPGRLTAAVYVSRDAGRDARGALLDIAERLRQPGDVRPDGLALVRRLLSDGCGPLYHGEPGELRAAALIALRFLDADDSTP